MGERGIASIALAAACLVLAGLPDATTATLAWQRDAIMAGQWWRLWSGHLVHFGAQHAAFDAAVLLGAGLLFERALGVGRLLWTVLLSAPMVSVLLLGVPGLLEYRGASGIGSMFACGAACLLWHRAGRWRAALLAGGAGLAAYTLLQAGGSDAGMAGLPQGVAVAWEAHLAGAACGLVAALYHQLLEYLTSRQESGRGLPRRL